MTQLNSDEWINLINKFENLNLTNYNPNIKINKNLCNEINNLENGLGYLLTCSPEFVKLERLKKNPKVKDLKKYKDLHTELKGQYSYIPFCLKQDSLMSDRELHHFTEIIKVRIKSKEKFNNFITELSNFITEISNK